MRKYDCALICVARGGGQDPGGSPGRQSPSCSTAPSSQAAGSLPGTPAQQDRAGKSEGGGSGLGDKRKATFSGRGTWQTEQVSLGPPFSTHLQDEGFAMEGNLNGVHSVPILLWQGQRVTGRRVEGTGGGGLLAQEQGTGKVGFQQPKVKMPGSRLSEQPLKQGGSGKQDHVQGPALCSR